MVKACLALEFANEVDAGLQRLGTLFPLGGANLTVVAGHKLQSLKAAEQFVGITTDVAIDNFVSNDLTFGVHDEGSAFGQTLLLDQDLETAGKYVVGVSQHRVADFLDLIRGVVPCLVYEVRVARYGVDLATCGLELVVLLGQILQLGGAYEREVGGVEEEDAPFAQNIGLRYGFEVIVYISLYVEINDFFFDL